jgi:hypothetical protein
MKTKEEVLALLVDLGADEKAVVNKLLAMGIKGDRKKCRTCPIAQYLIRNGVEDVVAGGAGGAAGGGVGVGVGVEYYWFPLRDYPQVKPVRDFILAFDKGDYPQLEGECAVG